jgi:3-methyladenine DNA glycosylase Mpg
MDAALRDFEPAHVSSGLEIVAGVSIGITKAADKPWRYGLKPLSQQAVPSKSDQPAI